MSSRVTRNTDSNYVPQEERESGCLMIRSRIWVGNIFPISLDKSPQNKILGTKYISGKSFMSHNRLENVLKSDLL